MVYNDMYVRCPLAKNADTDEMWNARHFIMGRVKNTDTFRNELTVEFLDPFHHREYYDDIPVEGHYPIDMVKHCEIFKDSPVLYNKKTAKVLKCIKEKDTLYRYYIQLDDNKKILLVKEDELEASFLNGRISPKDQLKYYEFQNPKWYLIRSVVNKVVKIIDNAIAGFRELAGCKIFLLPHQLNTIVRCLQNEHIRYMLADEVGMGKTVESAAILKIYLSKNSSKKILILVPETLKEQWRVELFLKFNIDEGVDYNKNDIIISSFSEIEKNKQSFDFVIIDEVHRCLNDERLYQILHNISKCSENILLLSATPLQKQTKDYLYLLRLLDPKKYDEIEIVKFEELLELQNKIIRSLIGVMDDILAFNEEIQNKKNENKDPLKDKEINSLFKNIKDGLSEISEMINDSKYEEIIDKINICSKDYGIQDIKIAVSYVCDNFQLEHDIIRNRRRMLKNQYDNKINSIRHLYKEISYEMDLNENLIYRTLSDLIDSDNDNTVEKVINFYKPLLSSFFSSAQAFYNEITKEKYHEILSDNDLLSLSKKWLSEENEQINNIKEILENPSNHDNSRIVSVMDFVDQELFDQKVILFTNNEDTYGQYEQILSNLYDNQEFSLFNKKMDSNSLELSVYRFQNEDTCKIMLCDKSGGEGRNFQKADYIVHLDLPWEANDIEQRIGRLDRLERDINRPDVNSVVVYAQDTFEQQLFQFWNEGINVFSEPLSGLEIIMDNLSSQICTAIVSDFKYGIYNSIPQIVEKTKKLKIEIQREQLFDTMAYIFKPMNNRIERLINYYNKNENELFYSAMFNWAKLSGFNARKDGEIVQFYEKDFSLNAAKEALFVPPDFTAYMQEKQNKFADRINKIYLNYKKTKIVDGLSIKGTFDRKTAISSDYIHYFAPGDNIFDCIITNAENSTKGTVTAFAMKSDICWKGLIFTFSAEPDYGKLFENNVDLQDIAGFRNFLTPDLIEVPISLSTKSDASDSEVIKHYHEALKLGLSLDRSMSEHRIEHLGRRGAKSEFLRKMFKYNESTLEWFKLHYPKDKWMNVVDTLYEDARKRSITEIKHKSDIKGLFEEIQRIKAAKVSSSIYYNKKDQDVDSIKAKYDIIYECLSKPKLKLESSCFIWILK